MDDIQFAGIQNSTGAPVKSMHDGRVIRFEKDEIKVLPSGVVQFLLLRNHMVTDGKVVLRKHLYKSVPLMEALKHVKEPQNKSVAAAKKEAEAEEKKEAALRAKIIAELKEQGLLVAKKP